MEISEPETGSDNYRLGREIARGGMAYILEAEDRKLGRVVAAKAVSLRSDSDTETKERFVREATFLARLEHPNIVPIHDIVWEEGSPEFYTMKLVKGRTLQDIVAALRVGDEAARREFTLDRLLLIFRKVCDAIAFAHSKGVIHRDLKPENIMVGEFGEVLVMDWGIAKLIGESLTVATTAQEAEAYEPGATLEGTVMGTPNYMSPEQAAGRIDDLDARSDIYSLGAILYSILTLRAPVRGATVEEILDNVVSGRIVPPTGVSAENHEGGPTPLDIPPALSAVVLQALNREKSDRYETVEALADDIEKYQRGFATLAERAGLGTQLKLLIRRHKGIFSTALAAWLLITGLAVWFVLNLQSKEQRAVAGELAARNALARSSLSLAEAALREGNGVAMQEALKEVPENLRDGTWGYLHQQSDTSIRTLPIGEFEICGVEPYPALPSVFVFVDKGGTATVMDVRTGERLREIGSLGRNRHYNIAVSPDGERLAVGGPGEDSLTFYDLGSGEKTGSFPARRTRDLAFSPDGRTLAQAESGSRMTHLWEVDTGKRLWSLEGSGNVSVNNVNFTTDGKHVVVQRSIRPPWGVNAATGVHEFTLTRNVIGTSNIGHDVVDRSVVGPDGDRVVGGYRTGQVLGWSLQNRAKVFEHRTDGRPITHILFSPGGTKYATVSTLSDRRLAVHAWDAATGAPLGSLVGGTGTCLGAAVHPVSGELVVCARETKVWSFEDVPERTLVGKRAPSFKFWGSETLVASPWALENQVSFVELTADGTRPVWKTELAHEAVSLSADRSLAIIGQKNSGKPLVLLRKEAGNIVEVASLAKPGLVKSVRLNPSATRVAASLFSKGEAAVLEIPGGGRHPVPFRESGIVEVNDLDWLDDDRLLLLATCGNERGDPESVEKLILWSAVEQKVLRSEPQTVLMDRLAFTPSRSRFAEAGPDKMIRIRDSETLAIVKEFRAHDGPITALAWHPSGSILASGSEDLTIRIWDGKTGRRIDEIRGPILPATSLDFSPGGQRIGCATRNGVARIWNRSSLGEHSQGGPRKNADGS